MIRKIAVGAVLAGALLAAGAPLASAASPSAASPNTTVAFGGVYPSYSAAQAACSAGISQGRWWGCSYEMPAGQSQVYLWVQIG